MGSCFIFFNTVIAGLIMRQMYEMLRNDGGSICKVGGVGAKANGQIFFTYDQNRQWRSEKI